MLTIRLAREGRHKRPFFRVVLTEHTKPPKSGYKEILGWLDPIKHTYHLEIEKIKEWLGKWAQMSSRVAKLAYKESNDEVFKKFIKYREVQRKPRKEEENE